MLRKEIDKHYCNLKIFSHIVLSLWNTVKLLYNGTPRFPRKVPYNWGVLIKKLKKIKCISFILSHIILSKYPFVKLMLDLLISRLLAMLFWPPM